MNKDQFHNELGRRIRAARKASGFSQSELARRAGMSRNQVANIERGETSPAVWTVARIAAACGVELHTLLDPTWRGGRGRYETT